MTSGVAIVGMACRFGDARSPEELWQTVLSQRQAFRRIPDCRLRLSDYGADPTGSPDGTYVREASVLEGWSFDRVSFHVSGDAARSTDATHWLALEVARDALRDAGFVDGDGLPRESTGVLVGNTLTGEFSRAGLLRLRWPFVRRMVHAALEEERWPLARRTAFLSRLETQYKAPFPVPGPESLAGGLSNTIAGRICNFFDLSGGGYTVDGACASSLLAISNACSALVNHDLDVAIAGGIDLSLDPFELVGFARVGALAHDDMRVYDEHSNGFWPGEGCGIVVLMRDEDAVAQQRRRRAVIRGWGISSDGAGGLTRPEAEGQLLALGRAYSRIGDGTVGTVGYFEGHGTGTPIGDATELLVLSRARRAVHASRPAAIGSIKANIGHTKAAAGVAGVIKAALAVEAQIIPPTTGCVTPHAELRGDDAALRVLTHGELWPAAEALRAGVSAMGFGGINAHVVIDGVGEERRDSLTDRERILLGSAQDAELFLVEAEDVQSFAQQLDRLQRVAGYASRAELADVAAALACRATNGVYRAAIVASTPEELAGKVTEVRTKAATSTRSLDVARGIFVSCNAAPGRIGFLFPGQGSPTYRSAPALSRRYPAIDAFYNAAALGPPPRQPSSLDSGTAVAQPAIVAASLAGLHVLDAVGAIADVAVGHSLGELTALHWAGAISASALQRLVTVRGQAMANLGAATGAMASIAANADHVRELLRNSSAVIAAINSPRHTVISGVAREVDAVSALARARGWTAHRLPVSHAFHSPLMAGADARLAAYLEGEALGKLSRRVVSTVVGRALDADDDLRMLLRQQVTQPVRFLDAFIEASEGITLWIEVGPGQVLRGLVGESSPVPVIATDAGAPSWMGLLRAVAAAYAVGCRLRPEAMFEHRFVRPYDLDASPCFLSNPCESAPVSITPDADVSAEEAITPAPVAAPAQPHSESALEIVRHLVAESAELPIDVIHDDRSLLRDLHLNSISVAQIAADATRRLGRAPSVAPTEFSLLTVAQLAAALDERPSRSEEDADPTPPPGVDLWVRPFVARLVPRALIHSESTNDPGECRILSNDGRGIGDQICHALAGRGGSSLVVCVSPRHDELQAALLLDAARATLEPTGPRRVCFVQHGGGATAFAHSLYEESIGTTICVVDISPEHPRLGTLVAAELNAAVGFVEAHYDMDGVRHESVLESLELAADASSLDATDVVLVTGGARGITAECALALAQRTGARLVLLGRAAETSPAILAAVENFTICGVHPVYLSADVTDAYATEAAVHRAESIFGPITAIIHGAGVNEPRLLSDLDMLAMRRTLMPKVDGLANVLAVVDKSRLRLVVGFGSTIGRRGLAGAASYALSNEWMSLAMERLQRSLPICRCVAIEWSVWSGVGIGVVSRQLDAMARAGVMPIAPAAGAELFTKLIADTALPAVRIVGSGRYGDNAAGGSRLDFARPPLRLLRFLERTRVHYDRVELVVEADLSVDADPYLADHELDGRYLFPAVMGLEAMAQAACAVLGTSTTPVFENVAFEHAVVFPPSAKLTLRIAALVRESGDVDVVIRSSETAFEVDHFRARCRFSSEARTNLADLADSAGSGIDTSDSNSISADPFYGETFFQRGRFRRVASYSHLQAHSCIATLVGGDGAAWFGPFHPRETVLGDAGARDAAIHAVQACLPHATVVPIAVDRIVTAPIGGSGIGATGPLVVRAIERKYERADDNEILVYDVDICDGEGTPIERWEALRLRTVGAARAPSVAALLGPYIERRVGELFPWAHGTMKPAVRPREDVHRARQGVRQTRMLLGGAVAAGVRARAASRVVSYSTRHAFVVSGTTVAACDIGEVATRTDALWCDMLTRERFALVALLAAEGREERQRAATRVWCATECLTKSGVPAGSPLVLRSTEPDGWITFRAGTDIIATYTANLRGEPCPLVFAMLLRKV